MNTASVKLFLACMLLFIPCMGSHAADAPPQRMKWQDDWNEFMQEVCVRFQVRNSSTLELNSIFRGKQVWWSGKVVEIKPPRTEAKESYIRVEMSPSEKRYTVLRMVFPHVTIHPYKQEWRELKDVKIGDEISFATQEQGWTLLVTPDSQEKPVGPGPERQNLPFGRMKSSRSTSLFLSTRGLTVMSKSCRNPAQLRTNAENGDAQSQYELGEAFRFGILGVKRNVAEEVKWYRKAAEQNHAMSQYQLGLCYSYGEGVGKDEVEAVKWFRKSAEQDCLSAQDALGVCYGQGQGVAKNEAEAVKWFRTAAEQNFPESQHKLGVHYYTGRGVAKDYDEAVKWFRKSAAQNCEAGQASLGDCYCGGRGVTKDLVEAFKWFTLAGLNKNNYAAGQVLALSFMMTEKQVADGRRRAIEWLETP